MGSYAFILSTKFVALILNQLMRGQLGEWQMLYRLALSCAQLPFFWGVGQKLQTYNSQDG
jgi:hypothetical protein